MPAAGVEGIERRLKVQPLPEETLAEAGIIPLRAGQARRGEVVVPEGEMARQRSVVAPDLEEMIDEFFAGGEIETRQFVSEVAAAQDEVRTGIQRLNRVQTAGQPFPRIKRVVEHQMRIRGEDHAQRRRGARAFTA